MAIANGDLAAAQAAATGAVTVETESEKQEETQQTETTQQTEVTIDTGNTGGGYIDTPDGEIWIDGSTTDATWDDGVVTWE